MIDMLIVVFVIGCAWAAASLLIDVMREEAFTQEARREEWLAESYHGTEIITGGARHYGELCSDTACDCRKKLVVLW